MKLFNNLTIYKGLVKNIEIKSFKTANGGRAKMTNLLLEISQYEKNDDGELKLSLSETWYPKYFGALGNLNINEEYYFLCKNVPRKMTSKKAINKADSTPFEYYTVDFVVIAVSREYKAVAKIMEENITAGHEIKSNKVDEELPSLDDLFIEV